MGRQADQRPGSDDTRGDEGLFDTKHLRTDLKGRSVRGGVITLGAQVSKFSIGLGSTAVLARILTPEDYGIVMKVTAVTGFVAMFKDMGISMATVQRAEINHSQVSTLFWFNVTLSLILMFLTIALAPAISWFYGDPRLTWITIVIASGYIWGGLTVQHQALLRRQMRFVSMAVVEMVSQVAGIAVAIFFAWKGYAYWALVFMSLATGFAGFVSVWIATGWIPGRPVRGSGVRPMLKFGGHLTGFNLVNYFARNLDNVLIGWYWGSQPLGLYSKAYSLFMLPLRQVTYPVTAVIVPALSKLQSEPARFKKAYLDTLEMICLVGMAVSGFLFATGPEVIRLVLGPQWTQASRIFSILAVCGMVQIAYSTQGWIHLSLGRADRLFRWGLIGSTVIVLAFCIGLPFGVVGVATTYTIAIYVISIPCLLYAGRPIGLTFHEILGKTGRPFLASWIGVACSFLLRQILSSEIPPILSISAHFSVFSAATLAVLVVSYGGPDEFFRRLSPLQAVIDRNRKDSH